IPFKDGFCPFIGRAPAYYQKPASPGSAGIRRLSVPQAEWRLRMTFVSIRRFCLILAANVSILGPFFAAFHRELRFSMYTSTGILAGYLFFVFFLSSVFYILLPGRPWTFTLMPCLVMPFHVILCVLLSKMRR